MADTKLSSNGIDFDLLGAGVNTAIKQNVATQNYKLQLTDINARLDTVKLGYIERQAQRAYQVNQSLSNIQANMSRRGLATGAETQGQAIIKQAQDAATSDMINEMNRERALVFQKEVAEFQKKQAQKAALATFAISVAGAAVTGGASLALTTGAIGAATMLNNKG